MCPCKFGRHGAVCQLHWHSTCLHQQLSNACACRGGHPSPEAVGQLLLRAAQAWGAGGAHWPPPGAGPPSFADWHEPVAGAARAAPHARSAAALLDRLGVGVHLRAALACCRGRLASSKPAHMPGTQHPASGQVLRLCAGAFQASAGAERRPAGQQAAADGGCAGAGAHPSHAHAALPVRHVTDCRTGRKLQSSCAEWHLAAGCAGRAGTLKMRLRCRGPRGSGRKLPSAPR